MKHKKITEMANKHQLAQQIAQQIVKSNMWLVLCDDDQGLHLHTTVEEDLILFAMFFYTNPEYYELTNHLVEKIRKENAN
jgi:hypothetical protein